MKKTPMVFLIPFIAIAVIVGAAVLWKTLSGQSQAQISGTREFPDSIVKAGSTKPSTTFLGGLLGGKSTPAPTPASSADLSRQLKDTVDDGGTSELDALEQDATSL